MIGLVVTLALSIILVATLLSPIIADASKSMESVETDQPNIQNRMSPATSFVLEQDSSDYSVTLDGVELADLPTKTCLVVTDKVLVRATVVNSNTTSKATMGIWAEGLSSGTISGINNDISLTLADGTLTLVYGADSTTETFSVAYAYVYDPAGEYAAVKEGYVTSAKLNEGDNVLLFQNGGWWATTYVPVSIAVAAGDVSGTTESYSAGATTGTSASITATFDAGDYDELTLSACSPTINTALVPVTYTDYESNAYGALLGATLTLVVVGLVIAAVAAIFSRRY